MAAARYELFLEQPVLTWQGAILLRQGVPKSRSLLVTVHGYRPDGSLVGQQGRRWYRSEHLDADFHYLSATKAREVVTMPPLTHYDSVVRLELVVRSHAEAAVHVEDTVSTLCFLDLDPVDSAGPVVITTHTPELVDV